MGGDHGPCVTVPAAVQALLHFPHLNIQLIGREQEIADQLRLIPKKQLMELLPRFKIIHTPEVINNHVQPSKALRNSANTSMRVALECVKSHRADACVSGGNTGALMALSKYLIKTFPGIERPALVSALPSQTGQRVWLLDLGANLSIDEKTLFQLAIMGAALAELHLTDKPRVALLNVGEEETKGREEIKLCAEQLKQVDFIQFKGFVEGNYILQDTTDVIVCDGFTGNVCLKTSEGIAQMILEQVSAQLSTSRIRRLLVKLLLPNMLTLFKKLNPDQYNGASLLGLQGIVIKSHGSADKIAMVNAIAEAIHEVEHQFPEKLSQRLVLLKEHQ